jgi:uncharacterized protein YjhX (UPF0386 family)
VAEKTSRAQRFSMRLCVLALAVASNTSLADTSLRYDVVGTDCKPDISQWQFTRSFMRSESDVFGSASITIFDSVEKLAYVIAPASETYYRMEADLEASEFHGDVIASMDKYTRRKSGVDTWAEVRDCDLRAEDSLPGELPDCQGKDPLFEGKKLADGGRVRLDRDAGATTINGIKCTRRENLRDGVLRRVDCRTSLDELKLDTQEAALVKRISRHQIASARLMFDQTMPEIIENSLARIVLVERRCYDSSGKETGRVTLKVDHEPIDPDQFEVPVNYRYDINLSPKAKNKR